MNLPEKIDFNSIPDWIIDRNGDRGEEIKKWYISYFFWRDWDGKEETLNDYRVKSRAMANAYMEAAEEVADLNPETENALFSLLADIDKNKLFRFREYDDIKEFLEDKLQKIIARNPNTGYRWEVQDVLKIINWLEQQKIPRAFVLSVPENLGKARVIAGPVKDIIADTSLPKEEKLETIKDLLLEVANPEVSAMDLKRKYEKHKFQEPDLQFIPASFYMLPRGEELVAIWCRNKTQTGIVQRALRNVVEISIGDSADLIHEITQKISPASFRMSGHRLDKQLGTLEPNIPGGLYLPLPDQMEFEVMAEITRLLPILNQLPDHEIKIPITSLDHVSEVNYSEFISNHLKCPFDEKKDGDAYKVLHAALEKYYPIPEDARGFLRNRMIEWQVSILEETLYLNLLVK